MVRNPDPEMVSVTALDPAGTLPGLTDATAGVVGVVFPPPPPDELEGPLEQLLRTPSVKTRQEKRKKPNDTLRQAIVLTNEPTFY